MDKHGYVFLFQVFLNTLVAVILKYKNLRNESQIKLVKNYYFEILVLKYLKIPRTQTPLHNISINTHSRRDLNRLKIDLFQYA